MPIRERKESDFCHKYFSLHNTLVAVSILLSILSVILTQKCITAKNQNKIEVRKNNIQSLLEKSFAQDLEIIHSIRNLFSTRNDISRQQFKQFVSESIARHPELQAIEQMIHVPHHKRPQYEKKLQSEGFKDFQIKEFNPNGKIITARNRNEYFVINYIEPLEDNIAALGYDINVTAPAREALNYARADGVGISQWLKLIQGDIGFVVYMKILEQDNFSVGVFRLKRFIENAIKSKDSDGIDFVIQESKSENPISFKYISSESRLIEVENENFSPKNVTGLLHLGNQTWKITYLPSPQFKFFLEPSVPYLVGLIVLLMTLAGTFLFKERDARLNAETATRVREEFITLASHELRTPLTPLKMEIFLIKELAQKKMPLANDILHLLDKTDNQLNHINSLIDDLLDAGRIQNGHFNFQFSEFFADDLIRNTADKFKSLLQSRGCVLTVDVQPGVKVYWDAKRIEQVIANCLSNSIKFAANAPVKIKMFTLQDLVILSIKDHGNGIPKEQQKKIFDRFERAVSTKNYAGLGLGLYITREIIEGHSGNVRVESELGKGAEFIFEIPVRANS